MLTPFYHVGIVVADIEQAQKEVGAALGLTWGTPMTIPVPVQYGGEVTLREFTFVYSVEGPPLVELVAAGSPPWTVSEGVHHVGYWSADLAADIQSLQGNGYTLVAHGVNEAGALFGFVYLRSPSGLLVELVDVAVQAMLAGGAAA
ncbi:MAG: hypothetical protein QOE61_1506 [Micromonosporaceae bacterium]|jgi:catechol 2,3-dioxygenase-like lactoylglutathione lyase family enzyme|nr:hypothetical protein [Micromonosporaceae bacterium]